MNEHLSHSPFTGSNIANHITLYEKVAESVTNCATLYAKLSKGFKEKSKKDRVGTMK